MKYASIVDPVLEDFLGRIQPLSSKIKQLCLFGSRARGDSRIDSDYDILMVVTRKDDQLIDTVYEVVMDVLLTHGRLVSLKIFPEHEFERLIRLQTPFLQRVLAEGVVLG